MSFHVRLIVALALSSSSLGIAAPTSVRDGAYRIATCHTGDETMSRELQVNLLMRAGKPVQVEGSWLQRGEDGIYGSISAALNGPIVSGEAIAFPVKDSRFTTESESAGGILSTATFDFLELNYASPDGTPAGVWFLRSRPNGESYEVVQEFHECTLSNLTLINDHSIPND